LHISPMTLPDMPRSTGAITKLEGKGTLWYNYWWSASVNERNGILSTLSTPTDTTVLKRIRETLEDLYGERLKGTVLYGSRARGDFSEDSDIDLLVLLEGPVDFGAELRAVVDALYDLQLEISISIEALPVDVESFESRRWPLFQEASEEGVRL
jgi:predicted nucleotidyltransferase